MASREIEFIQLIYALAPDNDSTVVLGGGDDGAVVDIPPGHQLVWTVDTMVAGTHFFPETSPASIGHKILAVNLSDLAAMGATPKWVTLALSHPELNEHWLRVFCDGFFSLARLHGVSLIGGDTTRGPLSLTVQAAGIVKKGRYLTRSGAKPDDLIYVTGSIGDAGLALKRLQSTPLSVPPFDILERLHHPTPRVTWGLALAEFAHAVIDISDGLAHDLNQILTASGVGGTLILEQIPLSGTLKDYIALSQDWSLILAAGDDYELCFTAAPQDRLVIEKLARQLAVPCTCVGRVDKEAGLHIEYRDGRPYMLSRLGYDHFSG